MAVPPGRHLLLPATTWLTWPFHPNDANTLWAVKAKPYLRRQGVQINQWWYQLDQYFRHYPTYHQLHCLSKRQPGRCIWSMDVGIYYRDNTHGRLGVCSIRACQCRSDRARDWLWWKQNFAATYGGDLSASDLYNPIECFNPRRFQPISGMWVWPCSGRPHR